MNPLQERTHNSKALLIAAFACYLLAAGALLIDVPLARQCHPKQGGQLYKLLNLAEVFGHFYGATGILMTAAVLVPEKRRTVGVAMFAVIAAGLVANGVKLCVLRIRPEHFDLTRGVEASFLGWLTFQTPPGYTRYLDFRIHSFPSGHTTTAVCLAVCLGKIARRGQWLFFVFAAMAGMQRVASRDHFLSDTWVGAATGIIVAWFAFQPRIGGDWCRSQRGQEPYFAPNVPP